MAVKKMKKLVRLTTNNQVAIPTLICRDMGLEKGAYLQVEEKGAQIVMTPMRLVDSEEAFYLEKARQGHKEFERGETVSWESVKKKLEKMRRSRKK